MPRVCLLPVVLVLVLLFWSWYWSWEFGILFTSLVVAMMSRNNRFVNFSQHHHQINKQTKTKTCLLGGGISGRAAGTLLQDWEVVRHMCDLACGLFHVAGNFWRAAAVYNALSTVYIGLMLLIAVSYRRCGRNLRVNLYTAINSLSANRAYLKTLYEYVSMCLLVHLFFLTPIYLCL